MSESHINPAARLLVAGVLSGPGAVLVRYSERLKLRGRFEGSGREGLLVSTTNGFAYLRVTVRAICVVCKYKGEFLQFRKGKQCWKWWKWKTVVVLRKPRRKW